MMHLYVHIPFCRSRCGYCDFASEPLPAHAGTDRVERYLEALRTELDHRRGLLQPGVETIYVGGGTPTVLPRQWLLDLVHDLAEAAASAPATTAEAAAASTAGPGDMGVPQGRTDSPRTGHDSFRNQPGSYRDELASMRGLVTEPGNPLEFTVEANPGTVDVGLLRQLREAGATRLSLGVQSFASSLRAALVRQVSNREIENALAAIAAAEWQEWNLDLVFGIPGQRWADARADLDAAVSAGPTHISLYDLTYTDAFRSHVDSVLGVGAREAAADFGERYYSKAVDYLTAAGYVRYEVSNFALPGHECRHNLSYWRGEDYVGIGASAVSTICGRRYTNPRSVEGYLAGQPAQTEALDASTRLRERAMLGLRTREGVDETAICPVLDMEMLDSLLSQGCVERHCGKLRLNPGFLDVSNSVIAALLVLPDCHDLHAPAGDDTHKQTTYDS